MNVMSAPRAWWFVLGLLPRPDGRGYFMTALRALADSVLTIHLDNICGPRSSTLVDG